ncbi:hypothetical protein J3Q64DRAFT_1696811 [Phycomyces blakesleeanus]|uniref:F-box domain-containing protein n=1 Tax=Phycomyces blakesleeanus TaxID=4837 RepID=A0ABR3B5C9_PHYBL
MSSRFQDSSTQIHVQLPPEIVNLILQYIPQSNLATLARINKTWYNSAMPLLYRNLAIHTRYHWYCLVRTLQHPTPWTRFTKTLVMKRSPPLLPASMTNLIRTLPIEPYDKPQGNLRGYVRLQPIPEGTGLETIETPAYTSLMENENYPEVDTTLKESEWLGLVTDQDMASVVSQCPELHSFDVSGCENLGPQTIHALATTKVPLQGLWLGLMRNLSDNQLLELLNSDVLPLSLRHLDLSFCCQLNTTGIDHAITIWGPNLTHLRLTSLYKVTNTTVEAIANNCPNLRLLHLTRCWQVQDGPIRLISERCTKLRYISIAFLSQVSETGAGSLARKLEHLRWMDITSCGINSVFKSIIINTWNRDRETLGWPMVHFQDNDIFLL